MAKHPKELVEVDVINFIRPDGSYGYQKYERVGTYDIEEVFSSLNCQTGIMYFDGNEVKMTSERYILFKTKGVVCVCCGIVGTKFHLEKNTKNVLTYHFNLYGVNENGQEIMITKDHIVPKSKGGKNKISNYQPMCIICNAKKGNKTSN